MAEAVHIIHPFEPFYDSESQILIVGSLPSVKSRETGFYYGHPQNRFWKMLSSVYRESAPDTIEEKKLFLRRHRLALYDSIFECTVTGSSDSSIRDAVPSDFSRIMDSCRITKILANGKTAAGYFLRFQKEEYCSLLKTLPSTSAANASFRLERLAEIWGRELI